MRKSLLWLALLTLGSSNLVDRQVCWSQESPEATTSAENPANTLGTTPFQETVLDNGLRVLTIEDFSCPIVAVQLWYHVGSKDEDPERQGFAHMFEHMMFRGTDRLGSTDHFDLIRKTGGDCNAYTTFDQTVYVQTLPANQLNLALWLEAERMSMLKIDQDAFDTERKVVEEERRMGVNRPYGKVLEQVLPHLFPDHPYRWSAIGSIPHLRAASVPELRAFWTRYYVPNNATLVVAGAVKHNEVVQLATRNFGWIPRCDDPPRVAEPGYRPFEKSKVTITDKNAPAPIAALVFRGVPLRHDDATALDLMTTILGGGESSRLYRRLVADEGLAVAALCGSLSLEQDGVIGAGAIMSPLGSSAEKAIAAMQEEIQRIREGEVSAEELEKAKNQLLNRLVVENLTVESKATALGSAAVLEGDANRINTRLERIRQVTTADIQRVAQQYLNPDQAIEGHVTGTGALGLLGGLFGAKKDDAEDAPITGPAETNPPAPGRPGVSRPADRLADFPLAGPLVYDQEDAFKEVTLDNGLRVIVVENREVPFITATLGFAAGAWTETKPGTATMAMQMLTKGTQGHSEAELASELERYAISLAGQAGMDTASLNLQCLPEHAERGMSLLQEVLVQNTMPEEEFEKLKKQTLTGLYVSTTDPSYIADREFRRRIYGDHPYARSAEGEVADIENLELADLKTWYQTFARPDMCTLIFAGDIDLATAGTLAKKYLENWQTNQPLPQVEVAPLPSFSPTQIYLVDNAGIQSQIRVGHLGFTHKDPSYFPSRVVSGYFGGAFNSRLNETIRVKRGLTYGAGGGFSAQKMAGVFQISTFSKNESTAEAVSAILEEINRLQVEAPSEKELNDTVSFVTGSYPATRETSQQVAAQLWQELVYNLPSGYAKRLLKGVASTTAEQCMQVVKDKVRPQNLVIVVVGPAAELQEKLAEIAPVVVVGSNQSDNNENASSSDAE